MTTGKTTIYENSSHKYGGFLKWWVSPTTMGFLIKNDHFEVFGGIPQFKETPIKKNVMFHCRVRTHWREKKHSQLDFQWVTHHCFGEQKQSQHITWRAKQNCDFTTNHATHKSKEQHLLQQQIKKNTSTKPPVKMFIHVCFDQKFTPDPSTNGPTGRNILGCPGSGIWHSLHLMDANGKGSKFDLDLSCPIPSIY